MSIKTIVLEEEAPNTGDSNPKEQSKLGQDERAQAEEYGALKAKYEEAIREIGELKSQVALSAEAQARIATLETRIAQLEATLDEVEEETEEESDVTLITPEPEPEPIKEPEPEPELPKQSGIEFILRL